MNNLKSCPFCGGVAELKAPGYEHYSPCWVKCTRCGAEGPTKSSELEAEKGWNERVQDGVEHAMTVNGWISVEDKLPETNDEVLTTYLYDNEPGKRYVESASYFDDGEGEGHWYSIWDEHTIGPVRKTRIAWMPMPKPYKPSKED